MEEDNTVIWGERVSSNRRCISREYVWQALYTEIESRQENLTPAEVDTLSSIWGKDSAIQKNDAREEIRPVGPHRPSCNTPEEAGFPAATFDTHPDHTTVEMSFSLAVSCMPAGCLLPECHFWLGALLMFAFTLPAVTHRCSRSGQRGAGRQRDPAGPSGHFHVIVSSLEKG